MAGKFYPINTQAGIRRDGTQYSGNYYIDGQHCRFQRGLPQKMGGYQEIINALPLIPRGMFVNPTVSIGEVSVISGDSATLSQYFIDSDGTVLGGAYNNRTPANFRVDNNNMWNFDVLYANNVGINYLFAHAAPNLADINSAIETPVYYGPISLNGIDVSTPLVPMNTNVSGGMIALHPYLLTYGNDGLVSWSNADDPTVMIDSTSIASQKIVTALQTRAGNAAPGALFWGLDSLIRAFFSPVGNEPNFDFDTISDQTSILSQNSVIEYDSKFFWAGIDRFLVYNGVVSELPNDMNLNFFYDNLNYNQRQKVWATKFPRKGEIWWFFPTGNNVECNAAVIYNIRENKWYNTNMARGCGYFEQTFAFPIWATNNGNNNDSIFIHEKGVNQVLLNQNITAIQSYFETGDIAYCALGPTGQWTGVNRWVELLQLEPDFLQTGNMSMTVRGREYSRGPSVDSVPLIFGPDTERLNPRDQRRHMTLRFESNVVDGYYEMGQTLLNLNIGDARS